MEKPEIPHRLRALIGQSVDAIDTPALVVDLDGVGQELASIPIQARCMVPTVSFEPAETLHYADVFIRYPFHQCVVLHNPSALPAKFEVLPQDEATQAIADIEPDQVSALRIP